MNRIAFIIVLLGVLAISASVITVVVTSDDAELNTDKQEVVSWYNQGRICDTNKNYFIVNDSVYIKAFRNDSIGFVYWLYENDCYVGISTLKIYHYRTEQVINVLESSYKEYINSNRSEAFGFY